MIVSGEDRRTDRPVDGRAELDNRSPIAVTEVRRSRTKSRGGIPRWLFKTFSPIGLIALWQVLSSVGVLDRATLASPAQIFDTALQMWQQGRLQDAVAVSTQRVLVGLALGLLAAVVLATLAGLFRRGEDLIDAPMQMLRTVPVIGLIPLLIIWFGIGEEPKVILIALAVTFPLYLNIYGGIRNVDANLMEAARTLGLGWFAQVRHVVLPAAMPSALVGLRYSLGSAWLALVFGETINATSGIGYEMNTAREFFQTDVIVVCLVLYAVLGLLADFIVRTLERTVLAWRPAFRGS
ncbi:sulfonate transport system permease protein [Tamaricihabitans halophyticus]|uniref:Sulfonate transport system permease protein n=1 Tax=Tamaricihabitans halophyticus TaxID=1262583 RepID=A0A4R2QED4_9PSEU|nr:ABC transporter permease subunit [Tamaricihabitans halophyticus]TCP46824.1 sulfonate transport system permease protein [Tamaricihabitans halophyticus]